jgi:hypothetical protein
MDGTDRYDDTTQGYTASEEEQLGFDSPPGPEDSPDRRSVSVAKRQLATEVKTTTPAQRILLLDVWQRSGLGATEFSTIVGFAPHTLYDWKKRFQQNGPAGLIDGSAAAERAAGCRRRRSGRSCC